MHTEEVCEARGKGKWDRVALRRRTEERTNIDDRKRKAKTE